MRIGRAYVWNGGSITSWAVSNPETEIDGDLFWVWRAPDGDLWLNHEEWEGQAAEALEGIVQRHPDLTDAMVSEDSPAFSGIPISEVIGSGATFVDVSLVEAWFHGTTASRLQAILDEGLRGDMPAEQRAWKVSDLPPDTVYVSRHRGTALGHAQRLGKEPVILEVDPTMLEAGNYCDDRDFRLLPDGIAWSAGAFGDVDAVSASLTLTGNVGYRGTIPPEAIVAVHRLGSDGDWEREETPRQRSIMPR